MSKLIIDGKEVKPGKKLRLSDLGKRLEDVLSAPINKERIKTKPKFELPKAQD